MSISARPLRILLASHSHPEVSNGGAEIAAFQLFQTLQEKSECKVWFLGCDRGAAADKPGAVFTQPYSPTEYIYATAAFDWFKFANLDPRFGREFERLLRKLQPDIVHFHHYVNFGVEAFLHLKRAAPNCKIVLTLHEYLAICHHYGQMVTKDHRNLCYQGTAARCQQCFPEFSKSDFFLRNRYIERFFDLVDIFISPSEFLAKRFVDWGIPDEKMVVLENLMPVSALVESMERPVEAILRIGFFGQISSLKGIDVILDAAKDLVAENVSSISFQIFGDYRGQPPEFQKAFLDRLASVGSNVRYNGPYDRQRVNRLMQSVDAVLVPSIWWENSPVVIQEALRNRRPVICSDIGGMAEKVREGLDGFHFSVGSSMALVTLLKQLANDRSILTNLTARMPGMPALESTMSDYLQIYHRITDLTELQSPLLTAAGD